MCCKYASGWDSFTPDPGIVAGRHCRVCGASMNVKRNCFDFRSHAGAMAKLKSKFDHFTCPNTGKDWHNQILAILLEAEKTQSPTLKNILVGDAKRVVREKKVITTAQTFDSARGDDLFEVHVNPFHT